MRHIYAGFTVVLLAALASACGGGGGGPDGGGDLPLSIKVTGALSRSSTGSVRGGLGPLGLPGLGDGSTIDRVVAVPHDRGSVKQEHYDLIVTAPLQADGSFELELGTNHDWVILLEDSAAGPEERVRAYVTIGDLQASLVNLPIRAARTNLSLGELGGGGDEARGSTSLEEASQSFSLSVATLAQMARVDDAFRSVINAYVNWQPEGQVHYRIVPQVVWTDQIEQLVDGTTGPERYTFLGYGLWITTNDPRIDQAAICNGSKTLRIVPPADLRVGTGETVGPTRPFGFAAPPETYGGGRECGDGKFMSVGRDSASGIVTISTPVNFNLEIASAHFVEVVPGWWRLEQDGEVLARFDLGLSSPVDADLRPTGAVPVGRATLDGSGNVAAVDLDWRRWDTQSVGYVPVETAPLEQLFSTSMVTFSGWTAIGGVEAKEEILAPYEHPVTTSVTPTAVTWFAGNYPDAPAASALLNRVAATWTTGGIDHQVAWYRQACYDLDGDGQSYCSGDPDDALPEESFCRFGNAAGPVIDENGTTYHPLAASYQGSFYLYARCAWRPAARPYARIAFELAASDGTVLATFEKLPYELLYTRVEQAGAGDYTLTGTAFDALGTEYETMVTHLRVLPFTAFFPAPSMKAELVSGGSELLVTLNYRVTQATGDCGLLLADATLGLLAADGCDTPLATNADCGGCGLTCGGGESCKTVGFCYDDGGPCTTPMKDCDINAGTGVNGCETDVSADRLHCGACGRACATGFDCVLGVCRPRCAPAGGDCDDDPGTGVGGCETNLVANDAHCGACGHACTGGAACVDGLCVNASDGCAPGTADCDGLSGDCEASLYDDDAHCGACGHACGPQERCRGGACHPRCPRLAGDCAAPRTGAYLTVACTFVGDGMQYRYSWGGGDAPIAVGDRVAMRPGQAEWECAGNFISSVPGIPSAEIPCPGYFPPLTARVAAQ